MKRILKVFNPIKAFLDDSRSTGIILLLCTLFSLIISNSNIGEPYRNIWLNNVYSHLSYLPESLGKWINDFLMTFFFLYAGREIKRELIEGELSTFKKAVLPFGAALGGMIVPAIIYILVNVNSGAFHGWGIPTATDIAFSLGVASLLGKRVPTQLKILLMALAIIDDLGAIIVIALFYGGHINITFLLLSAVIYAILLILNYFKLELMPLQIILSTTLWFTILNAGIEASIAGVLIAFALPLTKRPPIEKILHTSVNHFILPLFALANTAILIPSNIAGAITNPVGLGVIFGLVVGKPLGIFAFSWLLVKLKIAHLPRKIKWRHLFGMGTLAGIGFTMSIFTTTLAFPTEEFRDISKIAIIAAMALSLVVSWVYFLIMDFKKIKVSEIDLHFTTTTHVKDIPSVNLITQPSKN